ncbi:hypothetical protein Tco_0859974 [Tanacetum coccineum]|uniref:Gag-Pol polyprotein n=1 Tax=Tanacetum coccineum TaxID=301880 RepID=A0ABQ5BFV4_9ASTR
MAEKTVRCLHTRSQMNAEAEAVQDHSDREDKVNVQFLLQLQPEWQRFVTLVKQSQELKTISYHKLYDILKQHQNVLRSCKNLGFSVSTARNMGMYQGNLNAEQADWKDDTDDESG